MGKRNKVVKLTDKMVRYIIRAKNIHAPGGIHEHEDGHQAIFAPRRGESTNDIAAEMKVSPSTVKRVWMHWIKTKMPPNIEKFGRKRKTLDAESERLILEVHKEQNMGARRGGLPEVGLYTPSLYSVMGEGNEGDSDSLSGFVLLE